MKKTLVLILAIVMIVTLSACSNENIETKKQNEHEPITEEVYEGKLVFNENDLDSILEHVTKVVLVDGLSYKKTTMKKNAPVPKTVYDIKRFKVLDKEVKNYDSLVKSLEKNEQAIHVLVYGGVVTKAQWYENLRDEFKDKSAGNEYVKKPVGKEAEKKVKIYANEYVELKDNTKYLLLASTRATTDFNVDAYTVFEYDKKSNTFYNPVSTLQFTFDELVSKLK